MSIVRKLEEAVGKAGRKKSRSGPSSDGVDTKKLAAAVDEAVDHLFPSGEFSKASVKSAGKPGFGGVLIYHFTLQVNSRNLDMDVFVDAIPEICNESISIEVDGKTWMIGDGDDTQSMWVEANGSKLEIGMLVRHWPEED